MDELEKQKSYFKKIRESFDSIVSGRNTIDRLMKDKVEDYVLLEEVPLPIDIGAKTLWVGNITLDTQGVFLNNLAKIMANRGASIINMETMASAMDIFQAFSRNKELKKDLCRLISDTILKQQWYYKEQFEGGGVKIKLPKMKYKYFSKHVTGEKLAQILHIIYIYNFDAEKKNFKILANQMDVAQASQTYIYSWLRNSVGLTGDFVKPQSTNGDAYQQELTKRMNEMDKKKTAKKDHLTTKAV